MIFILPTGGWLMKEPLFTEENGILLARSDGCSVYQFRNATGDGTMTCYEVFPGTMLSFNDFHMAYFDSEYTPGRELHCTCYFERFTHHYSG